MPCRRLGDLKNGEEKTFRIDERAAKVFVIADQLSKNYCNEYYQLSDGQDDIFLSGKNKFNLANGNAFQFDNNESEGIAEHRKKSKRTGLLILVAAAIVGFLLGYFITSCLSSVPSSDPAPDKSPEVKTFSSDGMTITLTDEFRETEIGNYTVAYDSKNVAVFALREPFSLAPGFGEFSLEAYGDLVIKANNLGAIHATTADGLTSFGYEFVNPETKDVYRYFSYVYKTNDAFWMIQFATLRDNADSYAQQIAQWAKSVSFN